MKDFIFLLGILSHDNDNMFLMLAACELAWSSLSILPACQNFLFILLIKCMSNVFASQVTANFREFLLSRQSFQTVCFPNSPKL